MATKYANCPNCHARKLGPYEVNSSSIHTTRGTCPHCGKRYRIDYGQNKIHIMVYWKVRCYCSLGRVK